MTRCKGLAPVSRRDARVLILGSMPGSRSLAEQQYYAHPRNSFWRIIMPLLGGSDSAGYTVRLQALRRHHIALWDVVGECNRAGSLDQSIDPQSIVVNDFETFFATHRRIEAVLLNGGLAARLFRRHVQQLLSAETPGLALPSTSPANARYRLNEKEAAWRLALRPYLQC